MGLADLRIFSLESGVHGPRARDEDICRTSCIGFSSAQPRQIVHKYPSPKVLHLKLSLRLPAIAEMMEY